MSAVEIYGPHQHDPDALTWQEFYRDWSCACVDAWEAGMQTPSVTLPLNMFPHVTAVQNPCTGVQVPINRTSPFNWDTSRCSKGVLHE